MFTMSPRRAASASSRDPFNSEFGRIALANSNWECTTGACVDVRGWLSSLQATRVHLRYSNSSPANLRSTPKLFRCPEGVQQMRVRALRLQITAQGACGSARTVPPARVRWENVTGLTEVHQVSVILKGVITVGASRCSEGTSADGCSRNITTVRVCHARPHPTCQRCISSRSIGLFGFGAYRCNVERLHAASI